MLDLATLVAFSWSAFCGITVISNGNSSSVISRWIRVTLAFKDKSPIKKGFDVAKIQDICAVKVWKYTILQPFLYSYEEKKLLKSEVLLYRESWYKMWGVNRQCGEDHYSTAHQWHRAQKNAQSDKKVESSAYTIICIVNNYCCAPAFNRNQPQKRQYSLGYPLAVPSPNTLWRPPSPIPSPLGNFWLKSKLNKIATFGSIMTEKSSCWQLKV